MSFVTLSFLITTPECWLNAADDRVPALKEEDCHGSEPRSVCLYDAFGQNPFCTKMPRTTTSFLVPIHPHHAVVLTVPGDMAEVGVQLPVEEGVGGELKLGTIYREGNRVGPRIRLWVVHVHEDAVRLSLEVDRHNDVEASVILVERSVRVRWRRGRSRGFQVAPGIALDVVGHESFAFGVVTLAAKRGSMLH